MSAHTRGQKMAQAAYARVAAHTHNGERKPDKEYVTFAKKCPALIHTCGLAQAVAFGLAKKHTDYVDDLAAVLAASGHPEINAAHVLRDQTHEQPLNGYLRLSRNAIQATGWLKRFVEAVAPDEDQETN